MDYNSTKNQEIIGKFVQREVFAEVSGMVESILSSEENDLFSCEDIENRFTLPEFYGTHTNFGGGSGDQRDEEVEKLKDLLDELYDEAQDNPEKADEIELKRDEIGDEIDELENLESEPQDIVEWWIVSNHLAEKLKELGEPILSDGYNEIWGRTTSGQAILLDWCIGKVCEDMEILEG